ncbi:MAG: hypothetical protein ACRDBY_00555, partial [Cetobacterium sp.]
KEDIENYKFSGYIIESNDKGNGWTQVFSPSTVNKTILDINPDTNQSYLMDIKDELSEMRFVQEVMAEFGDEELGVYRKDLLEEAFRKGRVRNHKYWDDFSDEEKTQFMATKREKILILAVDWDLVQSTPNLLCLCLDKNDKDENGEINPIFKVLFRYEIPRTTFTIDSAMQKIIELNEIFDFNHISLDRGYGDVQLELLKKYGTEHPESKLHLKTEGYHFGSKLDVRDPHTGKKVTMDFKPFMVNNSVLVFQRGAIMLDEKDKVLKRQLTGYRIKNISQTGRPIYIDEDEHSVDTLNLSLLTFQMKYGDLFKVLLKGAVRTIDIDRNLKEEWSDRTGALENKMYIGKVTKHNERKKSVIPLKGHTPKRRTQLFKRTGF